MTFNNDVIANSVSISPTRLSNLQFLDISGSLVSLLSSKANTSDTVMLTGSQDISGIKNFTNGIRITSGAVSFPNGSISQAAVSSLISDLQGKQNLLTFDTSPISGSSNPITSNAVFSALSTKENTGTSVLLTGNQSVSGLKNFSDISVNVLTTNDICENISSLPISSGDLTFDFPTHAGVIYVSSATANFRLRIKNLPISGLTCSYTYNVIVNARFFANLLNINGSGSNTTMIYPGGNLSNVTINASATLVLQTVTIIVISGSIIRAITSISALW